MSEEPRPPLSEVVMMHSVLRITIDFDTCTSSGDDPTATLTVTTVRGTCRRDLPVDIDYAPTPPMLAAAVEDACTDLLFGAEAQT